MYADFNIPAHYTGPCSGKDNEDIDGVPRVGNIYNSYYQWVPIYLIFLAVLFYLPRCMWLVMEGGLMKFFGKGTTTRFIEDPEEKRDKLVKVKIYFLYLIITYLLIIILEDTLKIL